MVNCTNLSTNAGSEKLVKVTSDGMISNLVVKIIGASFKFKDFIHKFVMPYPRGDKELSVVKLELSNQRLGDYTSSENVMVIEDNGSFIYKLHFSKMIMHENVRSFQ